MPTKDPNQGTIELEDEGPPTAIGEIRLDGTDIKAQDGIGVFNLRQGAASYDTSVHRAEDQLVHDIAEDSYTEVERTGNQVDAVRTYTSVAKTTKIREEDYTYTGNKITQVVTKQYDGAGVLAETYTEVIAYTGQQVDDITGTLT